MSKIIKCLILILVFLGSGRATAQMADEHLGRGWKLFQWGKYSQAQKEFRKAVRSYPLLSDYSQYYLASCYKKSKDWKRAIREYYKVVRSYPQSLKAPYALYHMASIQAERGRHRKAVVNYEKLLENYPSIFPLDRIYFLLGGQYEACRCRKEATALYTKTMEKFPRSPFAYQALLKVEELKTYRPTPKEEYQAGLVLYHNGKYEQAISKLREVLLRRALYHSLASQAQHLIGDCFYKKKDYQEAIREYEKLVANFPQSELVPETIYMIAQSFTSPGQEEKALERYEELVSSHPRSSWADVAIFEKGKLRERLGNPTGSIEEYGRIISHYPNSNLRDKAYWQMSRCLMKSGDHSLASEALVKLIEEYPDRELAGDSQYWLGKLEERMGNYSGALQAYQLVRGRFPHHFYFRRAEERISWLRDTLELKEAEKKSPVSAPRMRELRLYSQLPLSQEGDLNFRKGLALIRLEMYQDATRELRVSFREKKRSLEFYYNLAFLYKLVGLYHRSIEQIEITSNKINLDELPGELLSFLYPIYYREYVKEYSHRLNLDPLLVHALIREESRFNPNAESKSRAMGLMQILPSTGEWIAKKIGEKGYEEGSLFQPEPNIKLGTWYLAYLLEKFDGNFILALIAYNGGPTNVTNWLKKSSEDIDEFIEGIPLSEPKRYVKKVMASYAIYKQIYK